jgi:hypothetical protein
MPKFDILSGSGELDSLRLESFEGREIATQRMKEMAFRRPGMYFVLDVQNHSIVARADTRPRTKCWEHSEAG